MQKDLVVRFDSLSHLIRFVAQVRDAGIITQAEVNTLCTNPDGQKFLDLTGAVQQDRYDAMTVVEVRREIRKRGLLHGAAVTQTRLEDLRQMLRSDDSKRQAAEASPVGIVLQLRDRPKPTWEQATDSEWLKANGYDK